MKKYLFVLMLGFFAACAANAGELLDKARAYDNWYQNWHSSGYGGTSETVFTDPGLTKVRILDGIGDSTEWTGTYLEAQAFRYAVEKSPEALANAKKAYSALHAHLLATGRDGFLSRYVGPLKEPYFMGGEAECKNNDRCHVISCPPGLGLGEAEKCFWIGDTSRDMYIGYFTGASAAYDLIDDPELRSWIRRDVRRVIDRLLTDGMTIVDVDGKVTGAGHPGPNLRLSWLLIASRILEDESLQKLYLREFAKSWGSNIFYSDRYLNLYFEYFAFKLDHDVYYSLMRLEQNPARKKYYRKVFRNHVYTYTRNSDNPWFDFIAMAGMNEQWPEVIEQSVRVLKAFPQPPNRLKPVSIEPKPVWKASEGLCEANYNLAKAGCGLRVLKKDYKVTDLMFFHPVSREPQQFEGRPVEDFMWQREPNRIADVYQHEFTCGEMKDFPRKQVCGDPAFGRERVAEESRKGYKVYAGVDYLAPYWMGRYYGFIPNNW